MASNHFGPFLLINLLLPLLCETSITQRRTLTDPVRIIVVSSMMHWHGKIELDNLNSERHFKPDKIFSNTNLANLLFAFELSRKLRSEGFINVTVNAVHSGEVQNRILTHIPFQGFKAIETGIFLLIHQLRAALYGFFLENCKQKVSESFWPKKLKTTWLFWDKSRSLLSFLHQFWF